jgi:V/A-type H+-transporting ATPase subunit A
MISGPAARASSPFALREGCAGERGLGEVVRIDGDEITAQIYEDTSGLRPGTEVRGDGSPLAIRLGPALLGNIFDGLLRPLTGTGSTEVRPGMAVVAKPMAEEPPGAPPTATPPADDPGEAKAAS